ncbi:MAG TPA: tetratricopeptide repeat protein [Terriglobales bacterium]|nr:tetratricopeptide repeat protein [Terriglobales bacterium]
MRFRHIVACTAVLTLCGLVCAQTSTARKQTSSRHARTRTGESEAEFQKAVTAAQARDFATAEPLLKKAAEENPQNYQAWFYLGYVYHETNRNDDAIAAYEKAVAIQPNVFESNLNLGVLLAEKGASEAGIYLHKAAKLKPTAEQQQVLAQVWAALAKKLQSTDPAGAVDAYQSVAELRPQDPAPLLDLGQFLESRKDPTGAEKAYKGALARDPNSSDALALLSNFYLQQNRLAEAEQTLATFLKASPQSVNGHLQLGRVYRKEQKKTEAAAEFEKALELKPGDADALRELAAVQLENKNYSAAEATLRNLIAKQPNDPELYFQLAHTLSRDTKFEEAEAAYLQAIKLKPDWGDAYGELAVAASQAKNYAGAIQALNARAKYLQETPGTYFLRATCFDHLRAYKEATEQYKSFLQVSDGKYPDQEWQARHRLIAIDPESRKK